MTRLGRVDGVDGHRLGDCRQFHLVDQINADDVAVTTAVEHRINVLNYISLSISDPDDDDWAYRVVIRRPHLRVDRRQSRNGVGEDAGVATGAHERRDRL